MRGKLRRHEFSKQLEEQAAYDNFHVNEFKFKLNSDYSIFILTNQIQIREAL